MFIAAVSTAVSSRNKLSVHQEFKLWYIYDRLQCTDLKKIR